MLTVKPLSGRYVSLDPLCAERHAADLWMHIAAPQHAPLWRYLNSPPPDSFEAYRQHLVACEPSRPQSEASKVDPIFFAIVPAGLNQAAGVCALMRIEEQHRVIEVGQICFGPALAKSRAATEAMYLLAKYVFEDLGYRRYEWKCNNENLASKQAAARLGFTFEGIFRQHMIVRERNRDTAWFSMLDNEWPARKHTFERWLNPGNFDHSGRQRTPLRNATAI